MSQPHLNMLTRLVGHQQALTVGCGQDLRVDESFEQLHADGFSQGQDFQQLHYLSVQAAKPGFDQLDEPWAGDDSPVPPPHTCDAGQVAAVQPAQN